jgi:hypothetical protein
MRKQPLAPPVFLMLGLLFGILALPQSPVLRDFDMGWLVRTGELIWQTGRLPATDIYSFSNPGRPWVLYQWGFELYLGGLHRLANLGGVVWGTALIIALTYGMLFTLLLRLGLTPVMAFSLTFLASMVNNFHWYSRPSTLSTLIYVLLFWVLEDFRSKSGRQFLVLPVLFLFWTNFHLAYLWGLLVLLSYGVWAFFLPTAFRGPEAKADSRLLWLFLVCVLATLINPYGPKLLAYLWHLSQSPIMNARIAELQSPDFHSYRYWCLLVQLGLLLWVTGPAYSGKSLILFLLTLSLCLGLFSRRHLPFFSILATLHLAYSLRARLGLKALDLPVLARRDWVVLTAGMLISLLWVVGVEARRPGFYQFEPHRVPQGVVRFLKNQAKGQNPLKIFSCGGQWGSYFIYELYPDIRVFIDSRFDMYGDEFVGKFLELRDRAIECPEVLAGLGIDFLIIDKQRLEKKKTRKPLNGKNYTLVYEDDKALVYAFQP